MLLPFDFFPRFFMPFLFDDCFIIFQIIENKTLSENCVVIFQFLKRDKIKKNIAAK
jgi:hypothetical protein